MPRGNVQFSRLSKVFLLPLHYCTETLYVLARTLAKETREQNCFRSCQNYTNFYVHVAHINIDSRDPLILINYNSSFEARELAREGEEQVE